MKAKTFCLGLLAAAGGVGLYKKKFRMPLQEYTQHALYMATLDDAICRKMLEGKHISGKYIVFPPKKESLQKRYHYFLEENQGKSREQLLRETRALERKLWALEHPGEKPPQYEPVRKK